jgi:hypothetical protein
VDRLDSTKQSGYRKKRAKTKRALESYYLGTHDDGKSLFHRNAQYFFQKAMRSVLLHVTIAVLLATSTTVSADAVSQGKERAAAGEATRVLRGGKFGNWKGFATKLTSTAKDFAVSSKSVMKKIAGAVGTLGANTAITSNYGDLVKSGEPVAARIEKEHAPEFLGVTRDVITNAIQSIKDKALRLMLPITQKFGTTVVACKSRTKANCDGNEGIPCAWNGDSAESRKCYTLDCANRTRTSCTVSALLDERFGAFHPPCRLTDEAQNNEINARSFVRVDVCKPAEPAP